MTLWAFIVLQYLWLDLRLSLRMRFEPLPFTAPSLVCATCSTELRTLSLLAMKFLIAAVALLVFGLSPSPGSGQSGQSGDGKWLVRSSCEVQKQLFWLTRTTLLREEFTAFCGKTPPFPHAVAWFTHTAIQIV